ESNDPWMASKIATARFYAHHILPKVHGYLPAVTAPGRILFDVPEDQLGHAGR
ncbi:MAG: acyl-CoA dehydrogenase C-terminal domain-containing protein, partial [Acidimicrobiia bacterium]|nr:acyl-CoA dehydrogenase C-terminal domain-containing protein [Acidimicrobiia bacterium]